MLENIKQAPFIRLIIIFISGIVLQFYFKVDGTFVLLVLIITFVISFSLASLNKISSHYKYRWIFGVCIHLFFLQLGIVLTEQKLHPGYSWTFSGERITIVGEICDYPLSGPKTVRCYVQTDQFLGKKMISTNGEQLLVQLQKNAASLLLKNGDRIMLNVIIKKPNNTGNPGDFDYQGYLAAKGVYAIALADSAHWKYLGQANRFLPLVWSDNLRSKLTQLLSQSGLSGDELSVATSLLIGDQSSVDHEIKQAFKDSGTMHVLAVSGMHVALIYEVLLLGLSFLDKIRYGMFIRCTIVILVIWLYAMVTGLSPSVLRATVMFTFIILGLASNRIISVFNSLSASAFFLLLINPLNLMDIGFQLSYFAVGGIVTIYPYLNKFWEFKYRLANNVWSLIAVSIAAQISTTPMSLYYFHQFPNLFLIANLIVVPLSTVIIYAALGLTILASFHLFIIVSGKILFGMVWILNAIVKTIEKLPFAVSNGFYPTTFEIIMIYLLIGFIFVFFIKKYNNCLIAGLIVILLALTSSILDAYKASCQKEFIVYQDKKNRIIQFRSGSQSVWIFDNYSPKFETFLKYARDAKHCNQNIFLKTQDLFHNSKMMKPWPGIVIQGPEIQFFDKHITLANQQILTDTISKPTDFIIAGVLHDYKSSGNLSQRKGKYLIFNTWLTDKEKNIYRKVFTGCTEYDISKQGAWIQKI